MQNNFKNRLERSKNHTSSFTIYFYKKNWTILGHLLGKISLPQRAELIILHSTPNHKINLYTIVYETNLHIVANLKKKKVKNTLYKYIA